MMNNNDLDTMTDSELLREILRDRRQNAIYVRTAAIAAVVIAVLFIVSTAVVVPKTLKTLERVDALVEQTNAMVAQANESLDNIDRMVSDVNGLVESNTASLEQALEGIAGIDIGALNDAIQKLGDTVAPLARLFGGRT